MATVKIALGGVTFAVSGPSALVPEADKLVKRLTTHDQLVMLISQMSEKLATYGGDENAEIVAKAREITAQAM